MKITATDVIKRMIDEQSQIIGESLAKSRAVASGAITYSQGMTSFELKGSAPIAIENVIKSYAEIFGDASVDVCLDVIKKFPSQEVSVYLSPFVKTLLTKN